jgi:hypothetical protein
MVAQYHPDRHQVNPLAGLASEKLIEINVAYETLSDPARRRLADGQERRDAAPPAAPPRRTSWFGGRPRTTSKATPRPAAPPRGSGAYRATAAATAPAARPPGPRPRYGRIVVVLALLPLIVRFGMLIVRAIAGGGREVAAGLAMLRGTVAGAVLALTATAFLTGALVRRVRRRRTASRERAR